MVGRDFLRREMAVVVEDRLVLRDLMEKTFGGGRMQQEVVVEVGHG